MELKAMLNHGNFLKKVSSVFILTAVYNLFGEVKVEMYPKNIVRGTSAEFIITVSGSKIVDPKISKLAGYKIDAVSTESFYHNINRIVNNGKKFKYRFMPEQSGKIEPIKFEVDGNEEFSDEVVFSVVEPTFKGNEPYSVKLSSQKNSYYLGETIKIDIKYRERDDAKVIERRYSDPTGEDLLLKSKSVPKEKKDENGSFIEMSLYLNPQKEGPVTLNSAKMNIAVRGRDRDNWGFFFDNVKWNEIVSNSLNFNILPSPTLLVGDFKISATLDKNEINSGEAINLFIDIEGEGNLEDFQPFKLNLQDALVYTDKPEYNSSINSNGKLISKLRNKFAIVLEKNITTPSFKIEFFNPVTKKIETQETAKFDIKVNERKIFQNEKNNVVNKNIDIKNDVNIDYNIYIYVLLSFLAGIITFSIFMSFKNGKIREFISIFKFTKRERELLQRILPYVGSNNEIREIAEKLSKKLNGDNSVKISFKDINKILKRLENENLNR
jgi:hypothetical protein